MRYSGCGIVVEAIVSADTSKDARRGFRTKELAQSRMVEVQWVGKRVVAFTPSSCVRSDVRWRSGSLEDKRADGGRPVVGVEEDAIGGRWWHLRFPGA